MNKIFMVMLIISSYFMFSVVAATKDGSYLANNNCATVLDNQNPYQTSDTNLVDESGLLVKNTSKMIGGWAVMFFKTYDAKSVKELIVMINNGRIAKLKITYPVIKSSLAHNIANEVKSKTHIQPIMEKLDLVDTVTTKYNHDQVIVTIYMSRNPH